MNLKVMVVDDELDTLESIKSLLEINLKKCDMYLMVK